MKEEKRPHHQDEVPSGHKIQKSLKRDLFDFLCVVFEGELLETPPKDPFFRRVSNAALANAALVLSSKIGKNIRDGGQHRKINPKSLGPAFSLCRRAGIDAALAKADFFSQVHPPSKIKLNKKFKTLRWRLLRWRLTLSDF